MFLAGSDQAGDSAFEGLELLTGGLQFDHFRGAVLEQARGAEELPLSDVLQGAVASGGRLGGRG